METTSLTPLELRLWRLNNSSTPKETTKEPLGSYLSWVSELDARRAYVVRKRDLPSSKRPSDYMCTPMTTLNTSSISPYVSPREHSSLGTSNDTWRLAESRISLLALYTA